MRLTITVRTEVANEDEATPIRDAIKVSTDALVGVTVDIDSQLASDLKPYVEP